MAWNTWFLSCGVSDTRAEEAKQLREDNRVYDLRYRRLSNSSKANYPQTRETLQSLARLPNPKAYTTSALKM